MNYKELLNELIKESGLSNKEIVASLKNIAKNKAPLFKRSEKSRY